MFDFEKREDGAEEGGEVVRKAPPWEDRSGPGTWQGIYQTFKAVLFSPERLFGTMTVKGGIREPLAFGLLFGSVGTMLGFFWNFLIMSASLTDIGYGLFGEFTLSLIFLGIIIISPIFVIIKIFISSWILHLSLLTVRGGKNGFEASFRVISYSQATQVLDFVPLIGGFIGFLWILIVQIIGLREIHETSYLRVIIAFLIPLALIFLIVVAIAIPLFIFGYHQILGEIWPLR